MKVKQVMYRCAHCPNETETCQKLVFDDMSFCVEPKVDTTTD